MKGADLGAQLAQSELKIQLSEDQANQAVAHSHQLQSKILMLEEQNANLVRERDNLVLSKRRPPAVMQSYTPREAESYTMPPMPRPLSSLPTQETSPSPYKHPVHTESP